MSVKSFFLSLTIIAILVFSAFGTTTKAYADDSTPPPPSTETSVPPADTSTPLPPSIETSIPPTEVSTILPTGTDGGTTPVVTEVPAQPILQQLPQNTTLTVVNAQGEAQPIVSQASADAIQTSDPIWCPAGQAATPGANGCTQAFNSFTEILTFLKAHETEAAYQQAGTIYVQQGAYLGSETSIDFTTYSFTNLNQHNLTITGGWNTVDNSVSTTAPSLLNVPIIIGTSTNPWIGSLSFNNLTLSNVSNQAGLTAYSQGDITLSNIVVTNSQTGTNLNAGNDVTINNSKFDQNQKAGATINAGRNVKISDTTFNNNGSGGLEIINSNTTTLANIEANNNHGFGADVKAAGAVTITNSFFNGNQAATIVSCTSQSDDDEDNGHHQSSDDHHGDDYKYKDVSSHMSDSHSSEDDKDDDDQSSCSTTTSANGYGLQVITSGTVSLDGVTASNNNLFGADVKAADAVTITNSLFSFNGNQSANVVSCTSQSDDDEDNGHHQSSDDQHGDDYKYKDVSSHMSDSHSSEDDKDDDDQSSCSTTTSANGYGLQVVTSSGSIFLDQVTASNNNFFGAHLDGADVIVSDSFFNNNNTQTGDPSLDGGLAITATANNSGGGGTVSLFNVEANINKGFGANILATGDVAIGGKNFFNGNQSTSTVACTTHDDGDDDNHKSSDDQHGDDYKYKDVSKNEHDTHASSGDDDEDNQSSCSNTTSVNGYGLQVISSGNIALDGVTASENSLFGARLEGAKVAVSSNLRNPDGSVLNSQFNNNGSGGLQIISSGTTALSNVEANNNKGFGADVNAAGAVAISKSLFNGNQSTNIVSCPSKSSDDQQDESHKNSNASQNSNDKSSSEYESSCDTSATADGYGLQIVTTGEIALNDISALDNSLFGAHLNGADIAVSNSAFNHNGAEGLDINSTGVVTLFNVEASHNQLFGANIHTTGDVFINSSIFDGNQSTNVVSCTSKSDDDEDNGHHQSSDDHHGDDYKYKDVSNHMSDKQSSDDKDDDDQSSCKNTTNVNGYGLQVVASGIVALDGVTASNNNSFGAHLEGAQVSVTSTLLNPDGTVLNSQFNNNGSGGLEIISGGTVTLSNVEANNNQLFGADVKAADAVTVTNSLFNGNQSTNVVSCTSKNDDDEDNGHHQNSDDQHGDDYKYANVSSHMSDSHPLEDDKDDDNQSSCNTTATASGYGLQVVTSGIVALDGVTASNNNLFGAHLEGSQVTVTSTLLNPDGSIHDSQFNTNGRGLEIVSGGTVTLSNVEAYKNQLFGADVKAADAVTVTNSFFNGNQSSNVVSCTSKSDDDEDNGHHQSSDDHHGDDYKYKDVSNHMSDSHASEDGKDDDNQSSCNNTVTMNGYGLQVVTTSGSITLDHVMASTNGVNGAILNSPANIIVKNSIFDFNGKTGLVVTTTSGDVTLDNVVATNNGLDGVDVTGVCSTIVNVIGGSYSNNSKYGLTILNAILNQSGAPVFTNNGLGGIFQNPGTCVTASPVSTNNSNSGSTSSGVVTANNNNSGSSSTVYTNTNTPGSTNLGTPSSQSASSEDKTTSKAKLNKKPGPSKHTQSKGKSNKHQSHRINGPHRKHIK